MAKIERKFMAHFINAKLLSATSDSYSRIGKDLEEYNVEMTAQVDTNKNIIGETSIILSSYEKQGTVDPLYADQDDPMFARLQKIIDGDLVLDDVASDVVEVKLWETPTAETSNPAIKEKVYIEVTSYGGDSTGYQIPYNLHYTGEKTAGTFDISTKTFTQAT